jgi:hypothetical protein
MNMPQPKVQVMTHLDHIASGALDFDIKKARVTDTDPIDRSSIISELGSRLFELGDEFLGRYEVIVGPVCETVVKGGFLWKPFSCGQSAIGFFIGQTDAECSKYPSRVCSLKPPAHIDVESLCAELQGKSLPKKAPPVFTVVKKPEPEAATAESPPSEPHALGDTERLAAAMARRKKHRDRRDASKANCTALEAEIADLEDRLAKNPTFEARVATRLEEVRKEFGL